MAAEWTARVAEVVVHGPDTRSLLLEPSHPIEFRPGQFVSCLVPAQDTVLIRPYSIASMPVDAGRTINLQPDDRLKRLKGDWRGKLAHRH